MQIILLLSGLCLAALAVCIYLSGLMPYSYPYLVSSTRRGLSRSVALNQWTAESNKSSANDSATSPTGKPAKWIVLDDDGLRRQQTSEVDEYGSKELDLETLNPTSLAPLRYLDNYKNPCWYSVEKGSDKLRCLPYFFVAGVGKCGTTTLFYLLQKHPQVLPANHKEIFYWEGKTNFKHYLNLYSNAINQIGRTIISNSSNAIHHPIVTFDATPGTYFHAIRGWHDHQDEISRGPAISTADEIRKVIPRAKIIVSLRDPTVRLYSDYNHFKHISAEDFHDCVERSIEKWRNCVHNMTERYCAYTLQRWSMPTALTHSMYDIFAVDWLRAFPRDQLHFIKLEEYQRTETDSLNTIFQFLELDPLTVELKGEVYNKKSYKIGPMLNSTIQLLYEFYRPHRQRLAQLLADKKWLWEKL